MSDLRRRKQPTAPGRRGVLRAPRKPADPSALARLTGAVPPSLLLTGLAVVLIFLLDPFQHLPAYLTGRHPATLRLTDAELRRHDGRDPARPLYLAVNATIYDVSAGRRFYGPGGAHHRFAGRDATRAFVTSCVAPDAQLTWDLRGAEAMFVPLYLDERLEEAAAGRGAGGEAATERARLALGGFGGVGEEERRRRRVEDGEAARRKVDEAVRHWQRFFGGNKRYREVGRVVGRGEWEGMIEPPGLCEAALKKRPVKGGKLEGAMDKIMAQMGVGKDGAAKGEMPDFLKPEPEGASP